MEPSIRPGKSRLFGFTLIELLVVVCIIAVLAAVALPRLIDAQSDARVAKANAIHGALRSSATLARSRCELDLASPAPASGTNCKSNPPFVMMDGHKVRMVSHFPAATADGIDVAGQIALDSEGMAATGIMGVNSQGMSAPGRVFDIEGGSAPNCRVTYLEAVLNGSTLVAAEVSVVTTGC